MKVCPLSKLVPALLQEISWIASRNCSSDLNQVLDVSALLGDKVTVPCKDKRLFAVKCHSTLSEPGIGNARNFLATQGQGCCNMSGTPARPNAPPSPWSYTGPPLPDPNGSLAEKQAAWSCSKAQSHTDISQRPGLNLLHQVRGKAGGRTVPNCWGMVCSRDRWGISIKQGNSQLYKCSAVQKRLPYLLQDYCSSFWPPPKPGYSSLCPALFYSEL